MGYSEKKRMLEDSLVIISSKMYSVLYNKLKSYTLVLGVIRNYANEFMDKLKWIGDKDSRDWLKEINKFIDDKIKTL